MPTEDSVSQALAGLRARADELAEEATRVNSAIAALEALTGGTARPPDQPSVRTMAVTLMEEQPIVWSVAEILAEYRKRGKPIHGKDPKNALRAALADAKKKGLIASVSPGRYKAMKWRGLPDQPIAGGPARGGDPMT